MGYYCKREIASVVEPKEITLANNPNFVVFSSPKTSQAGISFEASIKVVRVANEESNLSIEIIEAQSGKKHIFRSTHDKTKINDNTFFVVSAKSHITGNDRGFLDGTPLVLTAQNIKNCLLKNSFIRNNFEVAIDVSEVTTDITLEKDLFESGSITIKSKGYGPQYNFAIQTKYDNIQSIEPDYSISLNNLHYPNLETSNIYLGLEAHSMRVAISAYLFPSYDKNVSEYFKIVVPQDSQEPSIKEALLKTLENLKDCMLRNELSGTNLDIQVNEKTMTIDCYYSNYNKACILDSIYTTNGYITVKKGNTEKYDKIIGTVLSTSLSSDTIDYGTGSYQIELDVYTDHQLPLGGNDGLNLGNYLTTLSKSYFGQPLWFDLSTLLSKKVAYSSAFLTELELDPNGKGFRFWSDAGTVTDYRFIAKRTDGIINETLYYSSPLYVINGYDYTLSPLNLEKDDAGNSYILDFSQNFYTNIFTRVKPLTTRFTRTHIKGQKQYFNYLHKYYWTGTKVWGVDNPLPSIGLRYKLYTQSGTFINEYTLQGQEDHEFSKVNTTLLRLDQFLPANSGKTVGRIDVYLCRWHKSKSLGIDEPEVIISTPLSFRILPEEINEINDFVFLNRLGGWDVMNFGGGFSSEFKTAGSTIYKTLQPDFNFQSEIEKVAVKSVQEQKVVQTSPITSDVVDWLREMSASPAVYELKTKRYIIADDMTLKYNSTDDLYQVEMKYHYTDTFR